jgi:hypothetical protein
LVSIFVLEVFFFLCAPHPIFLHLQTFPPTIYSHQPIPLTPTNLFTYTFKFKIDSLPPTYFPIYLKCDTLIPTYLTSINLFTYSPTHILTYMPFHLLTY